MEFRARLLATLRAVNTVLEVPGVMVVGSEVPNLLEPGPPLRIEGQTIPVPLPATLLMEKLATERSGEKGDRDLLVALGLILLLEPHDRRQVVSLYRQLLPELRHTVLANLATLALLDARPGMPDPAGHRRQVTELRRELEQEGLP